MISSPFFIKSLFPEHAKMIGASSKTPQQILHDLQKSNLKKHDIVYLYNCDVWRYSNDVLLHNFFSNSPATFFIFHPGYQHKQILSNTYEISWPGQFFNRIKPTTEFEAKPRGLPWGFSSLNNNQNIHRLLFGYNLWRKDLISGMIYSQNTTASESVQGFHRTILDKLPDYDEFEALLPIRWDEADKKDFNFLDLYNHDTVSSYGSVFQHDAFTKCYANIVTETETQTFYYPGVGVDTPIVTEKTFKPILAGQIPLFLAASGHLAYLKQLGFDTLDDILPNNYDQLGLLGKIDGIIALIQQGRDFAESAYFDHVDQIKHNYDLVRSDQVDQVLIAEVKAYIAQCLGG